ncbi:hypothetical protein Lnau_0826 [Legionella nautarum]|uniref:Uncharacterized protein n=1 Tax=Legionella nautarum TaxID=45070 RepID=A0A0W0WU58_9GAMM|nr:hypothetical protein [Legionella nautarum]KTD35842.1 hypothetical protein Lnau_0826 [Legionella nautarum]
MKQKKESSYLANYYKLYQKRYENAQISFLGPNDDKESLKNRRPPIDDTIYVKKGVRPEQLKVIPQTVEHVCFMKAFLKDPMDEETFKTYIDALPSTVVWLKISHRKYLTFLHLIPTNISVCSNVACLRVSDSIKSSYPTATTTGFVNSTKKRGGCEASVDGSTKNEKRDRKRSKLDKNQSSVNNQKDEELEKYKRKNSKLKKKVKQLKAERSELISTVSTLVSSRLSVESNYNPGFYKKPPAQNFTDIVDDVGPTHRGTLS